MASASNVRTDDSKLSRADQILARAERAATLLAGLAILSLMALAVLSVGGRNFFGRPLPGYVDWIEWIMPAIALLGVAFTQRSGGHIRMDLLVGFLKGRALWAFEVITATAALIFVVLLVWGSWAHFSRSFDLGRPLFSADSSMDIGLPLWPAKLIVPIALILLTLRLAIQVVGFARGLRTGDIPPAVPLLESAEEIAAAEAATVAAREDAR